MMLMSTEVLSKLSYENMWCLIGAFLLNFKIAEFEFIVFRKYGKHEGTMISPRQNKVEDIWWVNEIHKSSSMRKTV